METFFKEACGYKLTKTVSVFRAYYWNKKKGFWNQVHFKHGFLSSYFQTV